MKILVSFAEYSVVNAMRDLDPKVVAMLMGARIGGNRTWVIEADAAALRNLLGSLAKEIAASPGTSVAAAMLPRVAQKIEEALRRSAGPDPVHGLSKAI